MAKSRRIGDGIRFCMITQIMKRPQILRFGYAMIIYMVLSSMPPSPAAADEVTFYLRLDKAKTGPGRQVRLEAVFNNAPAIPAPEPPRIENLDIRYVRTYEDQVTASGAVVNRLIHVYRVLPSKEGLYRIGPIVFESSGNRYVSDAKDLLVESAAAAGARRDLDDAAVLKALEGHVGLELVLPDKSIYMNEKVPVKVRLKSDWLDLENITLWEASSKDLIVDKFGEKKVEMQDEGGVRYVVLEYPSSLYSVSAGTFTLDPVKVKFDIVRRKIESEADRNMLLNDNVEFYDPLIGLASRRQVELSTRKAEIRALPVPADGRPAGFGGAVGRFSLSMKADRESVKTGEPVTLSIRITGDGNYDTVRVPVLKKSQGLSVYDAQVTKDDTRAGAEQVIRINSLNVKEIPQIRFSYFDPYEEKYMTASAGPIPIAVTGAAAADVAAGAAGEEERGVKGDPMVGLKPGPGRREVPLSGPFDGALLTAVQLAPLTAMLSALILYRRRRMLEDDPQYAALLKASRQARSDIRLLRKLCGKREPDAFYAAAFKTLQGYLGTRLLRPAEGIAGDVAGELAARHLTEEAVNMVKELFCECYEARYTMAGGEAASMERTVVRLSKAIEVLNGNRL